MSDGRADFGAADVALADRGVRLVVGTIVDMAGVSRAKAVPRDRLAAFVEVGMGASPSWNVFCVDFGLAFTPTLGVTGDLRLRIDPELLTVVDDGVAWAPANFHEQDGAPYRGCPRSRLRTLLARARSTGLRASTGAEQEFVLVAPDGSARPRGTWQGYGVRSVLDVGRFLADVETTFAAAGVPIEQLHAEYGADQLEISLAPADPLRTPDRTRRCGGEPCRPGSYPRTVGDRAVVVVADETTCRVAGEQVQRHPEAAGRRTSEPYPLPPGALVYAEYGNVEKLRDALAPVRPSPSQ